MERDQRFVPTLVLMDPETGDVLRDDGAVCHVVPAPPDGPIPGDIPPEFAVLIGFLHKRPPFKPMEAHS